MATYRIKLADGTIKSFHIRAPRAGGVKAERLAKSGNVIIVKTATGKLIGVHGINTRSIVHSKRTGTPFELLRCLYDLKEISAADFIAADEDLQEQWREAALSAHDYLSDFTQAVEKLGIGWAERKLKEMKATK